MMAMFSRAVDKEITEKIQIKNVVYINAFIETFIRKFN